MTNPSLDEPRPSATVTGSALRALGATEDLYWRLDSANPLYFGALARFEGRYDAAAMSAALRAIQRRHPLLRARIRMVGRKPWFFETEREIPVDVRRASFEDGFGILEEGLVVPFDTDAGPLLRCSVLLHGDDAFTLVMIFHHASADGQSIVFVLRDLLESLARQARGEGPALEPLDLVPFFGDRFHPLGESPTLEGARETFAKTLAAVARLVKHVGIPKSMPVDRYVPMPSRGLLIEPRMIDAESMRRVSARARQEGVSLQCVLNAGLAMGFADVCPTHAYQSIGCGVTLDVRRRLVPPVGEECGLFATGSGSIHRVDPYTDLWDLAREVKDGLAAAIETPIPFMHPVAHEAIVHVARRMGRERAKEFGVAFGSLHPEGATVSNLGRVQLDVPGSPLTMTDFAAAMNLNVLSRYSTCAASWDGRMRWCFAASSDVERATLALVADRSVAIILAASA